MAQKRMFDKAILDTDRFMDLSMSSKALYFLLGMEADDEGFVSPKKVMRIHGGNEDDIKVLIAKNFVIPFNSGVVVITDWRKNNWLDARRIRPTEYIQEKELLLLTESNQYVLSNCLASARLEEYRGEERSIVESNSEPSSHARKVTIKKEKLVKEIEPDEPFILLREIEKLEENNRRDLNIIALYFRQRKTQLQSKAQMQTAIRRHLRSAKELIPFTDDQLIKACTRAKSEYPDIWTLETITKLLTK